MSRHHGKKSVFGCAAGFLDLKLWRTESSVVTSQNVTLSTLNKSKSKFFIDKTNALKHSYSYRRYQMFSSSFPTLCKTIPGDSLVNAKYTEEV